MSNDEIGEALDALDAVAPGRRTRTRWGRAPGDPVKKPYILALRSYVRALEGMTSAERGASIRWLAKRYYEDVETR